MNGDKKNTRQQLSIVVDCDISPARIRGFMDKCWVNKDGEIANLEIKSQILKIKKEGCPVKLPVMPKAPGKKADDAEREKYANAKKEYAELHKKYMDYSSPRFVELKTQHDYSKLLTKLKKFLNKSSLTDNDKVAMKAIMDTLDDKIPAYNPKLETKEKYEKRVRKFESRGFTKLRSSGVDLETPNGVQTELDRVAKEFPELTLFSSKDSVSKNKVRFNDAGCVAIAVVVEEFIKEVADNGIEATINDRRKIMQPDHCVNQLAKTLPLYPLYGNLDHYLEVEDRKKRKLAYESDKLKEKTRLIQISKRQAKRTGSVFEKPKFEYPTFVQKEVSAGHAVECLREKDGKTKKYYQWYGIDIEKNQLDEQDVSFAFYVSKVCDKAKEERVDSGEVLASEIKISSNVKKFLSDLVTDFIIRVTPTCRIFMQNKGTKTINEDVVISVMQMLLIDSYRKKHPSTGLTPVHAALFDKVWEKVKLCIKHQTSVVTKQDNVVEDSEPLGHEGDPTEDLDLDDLEDETPPPVVKPKNVRKQIRGN
jgi:histone H3/H4